MIGPSLPVPVPTDHQGDPVTGPPVPPTGQAALDAYLRGAAPPAGGRTVVYRELAWSYRRPISCQLLTVAGEVIGSIGPVDRATRRVSWLRIGDRPAVVLTIDGSGSTVVADMVGRELGTIRRRVAILALRLELRRGGQVVGHVEQRRPQIATVMIGDVPVAEVRREGARFAGAAVSRLDLGAASGVVPGALMLAVVPALDAVRRADRRRR